MRVVHKSLSNEKCGSSALILEKTAKTCTIQARIWNNVSHCGRLWPAILRLGAREGLRPKAWYFSAWASMSQQRIRVNCVKIVFNRKMRYCYNEKAMKSGTNRDRNAQIIAHSTSHHLPVESRISADKRVTLSSASPGEYPSCKPLIFPWNTKQKIQWCWPKRDPCGRMARNIHLEIEHHSSVSACLKPTHFALTHTL